VKKTVQLITFALMGAGIVLSFTAPNAKVFENTELARLIFFHLPCAIVSTLFLCMAPYFAFRYLKDHKRIWDMRTVASMEIGFLLAILTLVSGIIFSDVQWGKPWNWDPRQTSFLFVLLLVGAYFALRAAFSDPEKQATHSAAYVMAALLPELFLIFVLPRIIFSLHPDVVGKGKFDSTYWSIILLVIVCLFSTGIWIYKMRVRVALLEEALENPNAELGHSNDSAPTGVVRPVSLPSER
jgi:heme exporter protein C